MAAHNRPSWDDYFMSITFQVAKRSTCDRAQVGAIIVKDRRILTTGYNGAPAGLPHCDEVGHLMINGHCVRTLHAEQNAIIQAALHGVGVEGGVDLRHPSAVPDVRQDDHQRGHSARGLCRALPRP